MEEPFEHRRVKRKSSLDWVFEPLQDRAGFYIKKLFSFDAVYLDERLYLALKDGGDEKWAGMLVCTSVEHHAALIAEFPQLRPHQVLRKWLHLPQTHPQFETVALEMVLLVLDGDARVGVDGYIRARSRAKRKLVKEKTRKIR